MTRSLRGILTARAFVALTLSITLSTALATSTTAQPPLRGSNASAMLSGKRLVIFFPLPYDGVAAPKNPVVGHYVWRFTVDELSPISIVLAADTPMTTNRIVDIVRASRLRRCEDATVISALRCTLPVEGSASVRGDAIRVQIDDPLVLREPGLRMAVRYWRDVFEPGGRYKVDHMTFRR